MNVVAFNGSPRKDGNTAAMLRHVLQELESAGMTARANGELFRRKVGAAVVAVRRAGAIHVFDSINHFFLISQMIVPGSCYWNIALGREKGEAEKDEEGVHTMQVLGQNMAWLIKHIART